MDLKGFFYLKFVSNCEIFTMYGELSSLVKHNFAEIVEAVKADIAGVAPIDFTRKYFLNVGDHTQIQYSFHKNPLKVMNETITEGIKVELKFTDRFVKPRPSPLATILTYDSKDIYNEIDDSLCFVGDVKNLLKHLEAQRNQAALSLLVEKISLNDTEIFNKYLDTSWIRSILLELFSSCNTQCYEDFVKWMEANKFKRVLKTIEQNYAMGKLFVHCCIDELVDRNPQKSARTIKSELIEKMVTITKKLTKFGILIGIGQK